MVRFTSAYVVRHPAVGRIVEAYEFEPSKAILAHDSRYRLDADLCDSSTGWMTFCQSRQRRDAETPFRNLPEQRGRRSVGALAGDEEAGKLNAKWRGKDQPTTSFLPCEADELADFPTGPSDVATDPCPRRLRPEAEKRRSRSSGTPPLMVHGAFHCSSTTMRRRVGVRMSARGRARPMVIADPYLETCDGDPPRRRDGVDRAWRGHARPDLRADALRRCATTRMRSTCGGQQSEPET